MLAPLRDVAPGSGRRPASSRGKACREAPVTLHIPWRNNERTVALIGPGRAGTTIALGLLEHGLDGRRRRRPAPDAPSTTSAAACLASPPALVSEVARGAALVIVATPDRAIEQVLLAAEPAIEPGALVVHLAGSRGLDVFDAAARAARPACASARCTRCSRSRRRPSGSSGSSARGPRSRAIPRSPRSPDRSGCGRSSSPTSDRARYHAAAVVASNHLVALLGQVERLAATAGVPFEAFAPARAGVGAERVRARSGATRSPDRSRAAISRPSNSTCAISTRPNATPTARWRARRPGSPDGATRVSTASSTTSASNREPPDDE